MLSLGYVGMHIHFARQHHWVGVLIWKSKLEQRSIPHRKIPFLLQSWRWMRYREIRDVYYVKHMKTMNVLRGQNAVFIVKRVGIYNKTGNLSIMWHWGTVVQPLLRWKSKEYYITCVCICGLRYPACNAQAPYFYLWPSTIYSIFSRCLKRHDLKKNEHKMCVLNFLYICLKHLSF